MNWTPHVTVATVIEDQGRFLVVREKINNQIVINQPAGHWEQNETLFEAAVRETLEETGYEVELKGLLGIYDWTVPAGDITFLRICFFADVITHHANRSLDDGIVSADWLTYEELTDEENQLRSPMVLNCFLDYLNKQHYPLSMIQSLNQSLDDLQLY